MKLTKGIVIASGLFSLLISTPVLGQQAEHFCYMTMSNGVTLNLTGLCSGDKNTQIDQISSITPVGLELQGVSRIRKTEFGKVNYYLYGTVVNNSNVTNLLTTIDYQIYNLSNGNLKVVESGSKSVATGYGLTPGDSTNFNFQVPSRFQVLVLKVKSDKFQGNKICYAKSTEDETYCQRLSKDIRKL